MRRTKIDVVEATKRWLRAAKMILAVRRLVPAPLSEFVCYERLCANPNKTLQRILDRVGLTVRTTDLMAMPTERHDLGGSPRFRDGSSAKIELDERWRTEMPARTLQTFERLGRAVNERFGYR